MARKKKACKKFTAKKPKGEASQPTGSGIEGTSIEPRRKINPIPSGSCSCCGVERRRDEYPPEALRVMDVSFNNYFDKF